MLPAELSEMLPKQIEIITRSRVCRIAPRIPRYIRCPATPPPGCSRSHKKHRKPHGTPATRPRIARRTCEQLLLLHSRRRAGPPDTPQGFPRSGASWAHNRAPNGGCPADRRVSCSTDFSALGVFRNMRFCPTPRYGYVRWFSIEKSMDRESQSFATGQNVAAGQKS